MKTSTTKALIAVGTVGVVGTIVYFLVRSKSSTSSTDIPKGSSEVGGSMASGAVSGGSKPT